MSEGKTTTRTWDEFDAYLREELPMNDSPEMTALLERFKKSPAGSLSLKLSYFLMCYSVETFKLYDKTLKGQLSDTEGTHKIKDLSLDAAIYIHNRHMLPNPPPPEAINPLESMLSDLLTPEGMVPDQTQGPRFYDKNHPLDTNSTEGKKKYHVELLYFHEGGKWGYEGSYISKKTYLHQIWEEVIIMQVAGKLPGVLPGSHDFIISVDVPDHPNRHPHLLIPQKFRAHRTVSWDPTTKEIKDTSGMQSWAESVGR